MDHQLVSKILQGKASEQEKSDFFERCESDPEEKAEYIRLKNIWAMSAQDEIPDLNHSFDRFWERTQGKSINKYRQLFLELGKYAAVMVVTLALAYWLGGKFVATENELVQTFKCEQGSVSSVLLADGSRVWLNSGSEIQFITQKKNKIEAKLSGEAYFEVEHRPEREFVVLAGNLQIYDLGTKFNVKAYEQDAEITATLAEGKIDVRDQAGNSLLSMNPNNHFTFNKTTQKYMVEDINPNLASGWKDGKFVFINMELAQICQELERWYGVEIEIGNEKIAREKFSSMMKRTTTVQQMMELLKITADIQYKILTEADGKNRIMIE